MSQTPEELWRLGVWSRSGQPLAEEELRRRFGRRLRSYVGRVLRTRDSRSGLARLVLSEAAHCRRSGAMPLTHAVADRVTDRLCQLLCGGCLSPELSTMVSRASGTVGAGSA